MKRIILMFIRNFFYLPGLIIQLFKYSRHVEQYSEQERYQFLQKIVDHANKGGNVEIQSFGIENIPKENGFMIFPNHQGMYDMLALLAGCDHPLSVVAKKEVKNVPLLKEVFKIVKALFMDREDVRQSMKIIIEVSKEVANGRNYVIFPEGTRSKNGNQVGEFKSGSFKAATKVKCPIIPVALIDSFKPFDANTIRSVTVQVHYLEPLLYEEYKEMSTNEIAEEVRRRIIRVIEKNTQKDVDN